MSRPAQARAPELSALGGALEPTNAVQHRRARSARVRRRRLLLADLGIGSALGAIVVVLAPGLAIAAVLAFVVLAGCGFAALRERRARRWTRIRYPRWRRRGRYHPKNSSAVS